MGEHPTPEHILQVGLGFWASKTLLSAVEMGVFTELAEHPGELEQVGRRLGLHPRSAADFLDALVALGFLDRERRRLPQQPGDRPVPRPPQAELPGRLPGDGQRPSLRLLGRPHRGAPHGRAAERGQARRPALLRGDLRRPRPLAGVPRSHDRAQPPRQRAHRGGIPLDRILDLRRRRDRPGRPRRPDRPREPPPDGPRVRPPRGRPDLRGLRGRRTGSATASPSRPGTSSTAGSPGRTSSPWATSSTTGISTRSGR